MGGHGADAGPLPHRIWTTTTGLLAVLLVASLAFLVPVRGGGAPGSLVFALGFLFMAGVAGGQLAALFRLPRLTGYLVAGVLAGPHGFHLFGEAEVHALEMINALALALIALQAGAEFTVEMLRKSARSLAWASLAQLVVVIPALLVAFYALAGRLPWTAALSTTGVLALGLVWASIGVSKSPAATLAVVAETRARGPVTAYAMGMVVVFDVIVLVAFAVAMAVAQTALRPGATLDLAKLSALGEELVASVAAGTTLGLFIVVALWLVKTDRLLFVVVLAYGVTAFCRYFHYDTLLVFVIAGFVVQNLSRKGPDLVETAEHAAGAVMVVFFATAGAHLDLGALRTGWQVALALAAVRVLATFLACRVGHRLARDEDVVKRLGFTSLVSQAGVTIGLVTLAAQKLPPDLGPPLATLGIAVVGINEVVGPVLFKWALGRAGEARDAQPAEEALPRQEHQPA